MRYATRMEGRYSPLYFLAAVGAGGLAVSFFMYLMWLTPHPDQPIPSFATLAGAFEGGTLLTRAIIAAEVAGIAVFSILHVRLLVWNLRRFAEFRGSPQMQALRKSNAETQLMAVPLALAMSVNVGFIVGAVMVPGLWEHREWLFPFAVAAFLAIGVGAMQILLGFLARALGDGGFDCARNNSLGQLLGVFALAMVGVGFTAAAAMSHSTTVVLAAYLLATFFLAAAIVLGGILLTLGFRAMMEHAAAEEATPTLWIVIPLLTMIGIGIHRLRMAGAHNLGGSAPSDADSFALFAAIVALQILFGLIGWAVMQRVRYFERWFHGPAQSPGAYALICPGVALAVSGFFLVNTSLIKLAGIAPMSWPHLVLHVPMIAVQVLTIRAFFQLNRKLLGQAQAKDSAATQQAHTAVVR